MQVAFSERSSETLRDDVLVVPYLHDKAISALGAAGLLQNQHPTIKFRIVSSDTHAFSLVSPAKQTTVNTPSALPHDLCLSPFPATQCV